MATLDHVIGLLGEVLHLGDRTADLTADTALLGSLPEMDSMAVATVIAGLEERFDLAIEDDDLTAEVFLTVGSLCAFVESKLGG
ncbi:acyl carrier protein [Magnetospira sp. QH-2]|uniref:acyl carrier protein n=1 Tax=Magnetospira sp. (strain QH-2) TaxID=1288970 RepID=UPI0003E8184E|nr:acyl carrier protein [Magnetospira sp. QH-2]CCQ72974.1 putative acyl-carrier protein (AcpP) [Magnetospira sp. QH-2]